MHKKTIYLMRHGMTSSNTRKIYAGRNEERLSPEGQRKVKSDSLMLRGLGIERIFTSPVTRAVQTAELANLDLNVDIECRADFTEIEMGAWKGLSEKRVADTRPEEWRIWNSTPFQLEVPARETLDQVRLRALRGIRSIIGQPGVEISLVVTHVSVIRVLYIHTNRLDREIYRKIEVPNGALFRYEHAPSGPRMELVSSR